MLTTRAKQLVLKCDREGRVIQADDDARALLGVRLGRERLPLIVDSGSSAKCERFLAQARAGGAYGWELQLAGRDGVFTLLFAGAADEPLLDVLAADGAEALLALLDRRASGALRWGAEGAGLQLATGPGPLGELARVNSDLVGLQRELAKRNAELAAVTKQRNELLAVAAHDLRNPLQVVQGYCDLLGVAADAGSATQRERIHRVQRAAALMRDVLDHTLEYARLEGDRMKTEQCELDLAALARECAEGYRPLAERKQIALCLELASQLPKLRLDAIHVEQIIGNLLSNAIKYSPRGAQVELTLARESGQVALCVTDHGLGIAEAELPLLFRPFQTTSARPTDGEPSTGLGLAIVRKLVEANGGKISVRSKLHEGSTFKVQFPIACEPGVHGFRSSGRSSRGQS